MKIYLALILLCISCSTKNKQIEAQNSKCNENLKFKWEFFKNIKNVEDYFKLESNAKNFDEYERTMTGEKKKAYEASLKFISKYAHVSFESMANYNRSYPIGAFEKDKQGWLKWYEENKCNNIQFK
jgi:hypothetical protein